MPEEKTQLPWQAFRLWKRGCAEAEYEDAAAGDPATGRFAIADGTSEASFAAQWARALAEGFVSAAGEPWKALDWLGPLRKQWAAAVDGLSLPWYAEEKREEGAFATLLGLIVQPAEGEQGGAWRAVAVGDSCLFHARGNRLLASFPLENAADFGNHPRLLGSRSTRPDVLSENWDRARGRWKPHDRFLLMTDALAQWFLRQTETGKHPLEEIARLLAESKPHEAFPRWVEERRDRQGLRNDDVTLVVIDVHPQGPRDDPGTRRPKA